MKLYKLKPIKWDWKYDAKRKQWRALQLGATLWRFASKEDNHWENGLTDEKGKTIRYATAEEAMRATEQDYRKSILMHLKEVFPVTVSPKLGKFMRKCN